MDILGFKPLNKPVIHSRYCNQDQSKIIKLIAGFDTAQYPEIF